MARGHGRLGGLVGKKTSHATLGVRLFRIKPESHDIDCAMRRDHTNSAANRLILSCDTSMLRAYLIPARFSASSIMSESFRPMPMAMRKYTSMEGVRICFST